MGRRSVDREERIAAGTGDIGVDGEGADSRGDRPGHERQADRGEDHVQAIR